MKVLKRRTSSNLKYKIDTGRGYYYSKYDKTTKVVNIYYYSRKTKKHRKVSPSKVISALSKHFKVQYPVIKFQQPPIITPVERKRNVTIVSRVICPIGKAQLRVYDDKGNLILILTRFALQSSIGSQELSFFRSIKSAIRHQNRLLRKVKIKEKNILLTNIIGIAKINSQYFDFALDTPYAIDDKEGMKNGILEKYLSKYSIEGITTDDIEIVNITYSILAFDETTKYNKSEEEDLL